MTSNNQHLQVYVWHRDHHREQHIHKQTSSPQPEEQHNQVGGTMQRVITSNTKTPNAQRVNPPRSYIPCLQFKPPSDPTDSSV